ncbi:MAG: hypothetical protein R6V53_04945 [Candidatus Woesearchaeota archaeon]
MSPLFKKEFKPKSMLKELFEKLHEFGFGIAKDESGLYVSLNSFDETDI